MILFAMSMNNIPYGSIGRQTKCICMNRLDNDLGLFGIRIALSTSNLPPVIQHGDSQRTALEEWITFSREKAHEQDANE